MPFRFPAPPSSPARNPSGRGRRVLLGYVIAALATGLALCIGLLVNASLPDEETVLLTPALVFVIAVMLAARYGGWGPGLLAVALSSLADVLFFLPPGRSLRAAGPLGLVQPLLFVLTGLLVIGVMEALRAAMQAAGHSEERFRRLVEGVREYALLLLDENGKVTSWNPGVERVLGWRADEILGRHIACVFTPEDSAHGVPQQELRTALAEGRVEADRWHIRRDGTRFFATGVVEPLRDETGRPRGFSKVMQDITERQRLRHVRDGQAEALERLLGALTARPELETLLKQVLAVVAERMQARSVGLWLRGEAESGVWRLDLAFDAGMNGTGGSRCWAALAGEADLWQEIARTRRPLVIEDERLREAGLRSTLIAPLLLGDEVLGALGIGRGEPPGYRPEEIELAQALAQQAALAVQLARLAEQEQQNAILEERNRLAREIHDTLAQGFTGLALQLEAAEWDISRAPEKAVARLQRAREVARQSLAEARRSVWALHPEALEHGGLAEALARRVEQMTGGTPVRAEFHVTGEVRTLPPEVESDLLRIGVEALTNALRHAAATCVDVALAFEPGRVRLSVRDDGQGFDPDAPAPMTAAGGFGLRTMRERARRIGAELRIASRPGEGTEVAVVAPTAKGNDP